MKRLPENYQLTTLPALAEELQAMVEHEELAMTRSQYAHYKRLMWEWMATRPDPIKEFAGHRIVVCKADGTVDNSGLPVPDMV